MLGGNPGSLLYGDVSVMSLDKLQRLAILLSLTCNCVFSCCCSVGLHYANKPMQYTAIFHGCINVHFQMKCFNIFLIFAQNIDCGYMLEPPQ